MQEQAKKREYVTELGKLRMPLSLTPLVFSTTVGLSKETSIAYKRMSVVLATTRKTEYSTTLAWMRCSLSFALIISAVACISGTRVSLSRHAPETKLFDSFTFLMIILIFLEYVFYIINLVFSFSSDNMSNIEQSIGFEQCSFL